MNRLGFATLALLPAIALAAPRNIIVDTDAGSDDMMAIAFLLSRSDVNIEAITVVNGIAHVKSGAANVLRLLDLAGKTNIPVYAGRDMPLTGANEFPSSWREIADALPGAGLPETARKPEAESAAAYLIRRLKVTARPVSILALGPLTNIAEALAGLPRGAYPVDDMVIMGGAVRVPGNLSGGIGMPENNTAEWNIYIDPAAARTVFESGLRFRLVPLDACNKVPFDAGFLDEFAKRSKTPLGKFVLALLGSSRTLIDEHIFYAWDPLAAVALINPAVLKISSVALEVLDKAPDVGRTIEDPKARSMVRVALDAEPASFRKTFMDSFAATAKR
jgi:pyrimidine-specific ribonucleoside hydrolase